MSDPAKTPEEIEDVLASVRRLVSDHTPGADSAAPAPEAEATSETVVQDHPEALVLTPSFRVTDPEDPWMAVATSDDDAEDALTDETFDDTPDEDAPSAQAQAAEELIAEIVTAEPAATQPTDETTSDGTNWRPDDRLASFDAVGGADDTAPSTAAWPDEGSAEDQDNVASEDDIADLIHLDGPRLPVSEFESETGDDGWPEGGTETALLTLVARRDPSPELDDDAVSDFDDSVDQDMDLEGDADDEETAAEAPLTDAAETADDVAQDEVASVDVSHGDTTIDDATNGDSTLDDFASDGASSDDGEHDAERAAQVETQDEPPEHHAETADPSPEDTDPQSELADALSDATPMFARSTSRIEETSDASVEDLGETPSPFTFPETDDGILDEDTLREIIVDVVREELQGVLGQRITRNVRKMVRREIRLALAVEDLE